MKITPSFVKIIALFLACYGAPQVESRAPSPPYYNFYADPAPYGYYAPLNNLIDVDMTDEEVARELVRQEHERNPGRTLISPELEVEALVAQFKGLAPYAPLVPVAPGSRYLRAGYPRVNNIPRLCGKDLMSEFDRVCMGCFEGTMAHGPRYIDTRDEVLNAPSWHPGYRSDPAFNPVQRPNQYWATQYMIEHAGSQGAGYDCCYGPVPKCDISYIVMNYCCNRDFNGQCQCV